ncbi:MAG: ParB/RepB/Spo0J family partition protein [Haliscomenobacter sp.]|uniref:ParB/RepB/Spo0J family partition protein n=1 Tax=Haliscomenobacter sp. TaxID=2717303 RepID=UPI0029BD4E78|nr:ParB/RepB/Spo0J family partition protein [Haliscomenobacter sp.]MDX2072394.1 ParB/RepB/Spo0J family partition protein [Haliscomenobacter sp.]
MAKKVNPSSTGPKKITPDSLRSGISKIFNTESLTTAIEADPDLVVKELSNHFLMVPIEQIEANPEQPRTQFLEAELEELASSIKIHGVIQPITVRRLEPQKFQIISGERRFKASQIAELTEIPAYIRLVNDTEMLEMALIENIQRQDLNPIDIARTYARLKKECNLKDEELADRMGKGKIDRSTVTNYMRLLKLRPDVITALESFQISLGHGKILAGLVDSPDIQGILLKKILEEGTSVSELQKIVKEYKNTKLVAGTSKPIPKGLPEEYKDVQKQFQSFFGVKKLQLKVNAEGKGQIVIPFANTKALNDLLDRLDENN